MKHPWPAPHLAWTKVKAWMRWGGEPLSPVLGTTGGLPKYGYTSSMVNWLSARLIDTTRTAAPLIRRIVARVVGGIGGRHGPNLAGHQRVLSSGGIG